MWICTVHRCEHASMEAKYFVWKFSSFSAHIRIWSGLSYITAAQYGPCNKKGDIEALETVQKKATEIMSQLKNLKYEDRLRACKLPTLHFRRIQWDMIKTFKIVTGIYDRVVSPIILGCVLHMQQEDTTSDY